MRKDINKAEKEAVTRETINGSSLSDRSQMEYADRHAAQGFLSKVWSRGQCEQSKLPLTLGEFRQKCQDAGRLLETQRKAGDTNQAPLNNLDADRLFENLSKTYGYRRPWFPQLRDGKRHPILSKLYGFYFLLSCLSPWAKSRNRIIITHKKDGGKA